eukprot:jgi/Psemu1/2152/gm1.2152_g
MSEPKKAICFVATHVFQTRREPDSKGDGYLFCHEAVVTLTQEDRVLCLWTSNHVKAIGMTEDGAMYYHIDPKRFKKFRPTISIDLLEGSNTKSIDLVRIRSAGGNFALGKLRVTRKVNKTTIKMYIKEYKKLNRFLMSF